MNRADERDIKVAFDLYEARRAAPALLAALKFLGRPHDGDLCFCGVVTGDAREHAMVCRNARAALAHAEAGEQP